MSIKTLLILIITFIIFNLNINGNYFTYKWVAFEIFSIAIISHHINKQYGIFFGLLFFYFGWVNCCQGIEVKDALQLLAIQKGTVTLILFGAMLLIGKKILSFLTSEVWLYLLLACISQVFIGYPFSGFTGNTSLNACLISMMFFMAIPAANKFFAGVYYLFIVSVISIISIGSSIGLISLIVGATVYMLFVEKSLLRYFALILPIVTIPVMIYFYKEQAFSFSGRPDIWNSIWLYFKNETNVFFGSGVGSGFYIIPKAILKYSETKKEITPWAHNEFIQITLESGIIGITIFILASIQFIKKTILSKKYNLTAFTICYLVICFGNFPNRLAPEAIIILSAMFMNYHKSEAGDSL